MVLQIYGVYDKKSQIYRWPQFVRNEGTALRSLETGVLDLQTEIGKYPSDFELYRLGSFDDERGVFISMDQPTFVVSAQTLFTAAMRREKEEEKDEIR